MKKIFIILILLIFNTVLISSSFSRTRKSVLQLYNLLPEKIDGLYDKKYKIFFKDNRWKTISASSSQEFNIIVDNRNGYIKILDRGTGGGSTKLVIVLFISPRNNYLAIQNTTGGTAIPNNKLLFFRYKHNRWENVTSRIMTKIQINRLLHKKYNSEEIKKIMSISKKILRSLELYNYRLPRYGTTIISWLKFDNNPIFLKYILPNRISNKKQLKLIISFIKNIKYNYIEYKWTPKNDKFIIKRIYIKN